MRALGISFRLNAGAFVFLRFFSFFFLLLSLGDTARAVAALLQQVVFCLCALINCVDSVVRLIDSSDIQILHTQSATITTQYSAPFSSLFLILPLNECSASQLEMQFGSRATGVCVW